MHAKVSEAKEKMHKAVLHMQDEFGGIRTGRATPAIAEKLRVDYYGSEVPLHQLARFSDHEQRELGCAVRQECDEGHRNIQASDMGVTASNDGAVIRLTFPERTADRRKQLVKVVKARAEDGRVAVRNVRRHSRQELEQLEKDGEISRDDLERIEKDLEKLTHEVIAEIDTMSGHKEKELLEV
jgi:ribosome recycling factor